MRLRKTTPLRGLRALRDAHPVTLAESAPAGADFRFELPEGSEGVRETLKIMRALVKRWRGDPQMIAFANNLIAGLPEKEDALIVGKIFDYVRSGITYRADPNEVETLRSPDRLIVERVGDCDDKATLLSTLLEALGYDTRFVVIGFAPDEFEHVYNEIRLGRWIALDSTEPYPMGWSPYEGRPGEVPRKILARMNWNI